MTKRKAELHGGQASLYLSAPRLTALREELATLQNALRSIQPRVDPAELRLVRRFHAQLASTSAMVNFSGTQGAGVSTLIRLLAGDLGGAPEREATLEGQTNAPARAAHVLPVRLSDTGTQGASSKAEDETEGSAENGLNLVVLRADWLIGTIDMSLVRLLREKSQQPMILFVNRIDLLDDPAEAIPVIRKRLSDLISRHHAAAKPVIVFGSLAWAEAAQTARLSALPEQSKEALLAVAEAAEVDGDDHAPSYVWKLSGLPELMDAIGKALDESPLRRMLAKIRRHLESALADLEDAGISANLGGGPAPVEPAKFAEVSRRSDALSLRLLADMDRQAGLIVDQVRARIERIGSDFAEAAVADMLLRFDRRDAPLEWAMDPFRLKLQLRSSCLAFAQSCRALTDRMLRRTSREFSTLARDVFGAELIAAAPEANNGSFVSVRMVEPPSVMHTDTAWIWRPRPGQIKVAQMREFRSHINLKVATLLKEAEDTQISGPAQAMRHRLEDFLHQQTEALFDLATRLGATEAAPEMVQAQGHGSTTQASPPALEKS